MLHSFSLLWSNKYITIGLKFVLACLGVASLLFTVPYNSAYATPWLLVNSSGNMLLLFGTWEIDRTYFDCAAIVTWLVVLISVPLYRNHLKYLIINSRYWCVVIGILAMTCFGITKDSILIFYQLLFGSFGVLCLFPICYQNEDESRWKFFNKISWWFFPLTLFCLTCIISTFVYEHIPFNMDSAAEIFTARTMQKGRTSVNPPPAECLDYFEHLGLLIYQGHWISQFPPGHAFALAIGLLFNAAWMIGPISSVITACLCYRIAMVCFDKSTARLAVALFCASPYVILYSSEYLNHSTALLFFSLGLYGFVLWWNDNSVRSAALSGFGIGYCAITRPLTALGITMPLAIMGFWKIVASLKNIRLCTQRIKSGVFGVLIAVLFICLFGAYNQYTTGDFLTSGYVAHFGTGHNPGFGTAPNGRPHTIGIGIGSAIENIVLLNRHLFNLPFPSLLFITTFFLLPNKRRVWDYLFLGCCLSLIIAYMTYWYHENFFGPRFMYEASLMLCCLSARGIRVFENRLSRLRAIPTIAVLLSYMLTLTVQTDLFQRFRLWNESAAPVNAVLHYQSEHAGHNAASVFLIQGNYSTAVAYIDPELRNGPYLIRGGESAMECGELLGERIFRVDRNNVITQVPARIISEH
jgi:hypothetical protein